MAGLTEEMPLEVERRLAEAQRRARLRNRKCGAKTERARPARCAPCRGQSAVGCMAGFLRGQKRLRGGRA